MASKKPQNIPTGFDIWDDVEELTAYMNQLKKKGMWKEEVPQDSHEDISKYIHERFSGSPKAGFDYTNYIRPLRNNILSALERPDKEVTDTSTIQALDKLRKEYPPTEWRLIPMSRLTDDKHGWYTNVQITAHNLRTGELQLIRITGRDKPTAELRANLSVQRYMMNQGAKTSRVSGLKAFNPYTTELMDVKPLNPRYTQIILNKGKNKVRPEQESKMQTRLPFKWYTGKGEYGPEVAFLDIETAGKKTNASILSTAVLRMRQNLTTGEFELLSKQERMYYPKVTELASSDYKQSLVVHGLTNKLIRQFRREHLFKGSQHFDDAARQELLDFIGDAPVIGYNSNQFDIPKILGVNLAPNQSLPQSQWLPGGLIDLYHIAEGTRGNYPGYNKLHVLFRALTGKNMEDVVGEHHGAMADTAALPIMLSIMCRLPGRMGAVSRYILRHMGDSGLGSVVGTQWKDSNLNHELSEIVMANGFIPPSYEDKEQNIDALKQLGANPDNWKPEDFAEMTYEELQDFMDIMKERKSSGGGFGLPPSMAKRFIDAAVSMGEGTNRFSEAMSRHLYLQKVATVQKLARLPSKVAAMKAAQAMGYSETSATEFASRATALRQSVMSAKSEDLELLYSPEEIEQQEIKAAAQQFELDAAIATARAGERDANLKHVWGNDWQSAIEEARAKGGNTPRKASWEQKGWDDFAWTEPGYGLAGYGLGNAWQRKLYDTIGRAYGLGGGEGYKQHIKDWAVGDISGIDHRIHQDYIDGKEIKESTKALKDFTSGVKAATTAIAGGISSSRMYDFNQWRHTAVQQYDAAWSEAQPLFVGPLKYAYSPLRRWGQAASLDIQSRVDKARSVASIVGGIGQIGLSFLGPAGMAAGAVFNGVTQVVGRAGNSRIAAAGEQLRNTINLWGGMVEWVAAPFRLLGAAANTLRMSFSRLSSFLGGGMKDMQNLGLPLSTLTGTTYAGYQYSRQIDRLFHQQAGTTNAAYETIGMAGQGLYTLGQLNQQQLLSSAMLGQFDKVYSTAPNSKERYASMVNSIYARMMGENDEQRARTLYLASGIDQSLPGKLQQMLNLGVSDFGALANNTWVFTDPLTGRQRGPMYQNALSDKEKRSFDITQYEWGIGLDQFANSRMRITNKLWQSFGKPLMNGFNEILDAFATGGIKGGMTRFKEIAKDMWSRISAALTEATGQDFGGNIKDALGNVWNKILDVVGPLVVKATPYIAQLINEVVSAWDKAIVYIASTIGGLVDRLSSYHLVLQKDPDSALGFKLAVKGIRPAEYYSDMAFDESAPGAYQPPSLMARGIKRIVWPGQPRGRSPNGLYWEGTDSLQLPNTEKLREFIYANRGYTDEISLSWDGNTYRGADEVYKQLLAMASVSTENSGLTKYSNKLFQEAKGELDGKDSEAYRMAVQVQSLVHELAQTFSLDDPEKLQQIVAKGIFELHYNGKKVGTMEGDTTGKTSATGDVKAQGPGSIMTEYTNRYMNAASGRF